MTKEQFASARQRMVQTQLRQRGICDTTVLEAFGRVPRHRFVPTEEWSQAYADHPLPIGAGQTISQPYVVAYMLQQLELTGDERILEIGTGSGYQTALLAEMAAQVYTVEFFPELAARGLQVLDDLGYTNIQARLGDGGTGWLEFAPFDAIIGSAAPLDVPRPLLDQLAPDGRLIMPIGGFHQQLIMVTRTRDNLFKRIPLLPVRFVPMQSGSS